MKILIENEQSLTNMISFLKKGNYDFSYIYNQKSKNWILDIEEGVKYFYQSNQSYYFF